MTFYLWMEMNEHNTWSWHSKPWSCWCWRCAEIVHLWMAAQSCLCFSLCLCVCVCLCLCRWWRWAETVHSWRLNLDSWHPWTSHGTRPGDPCKLQCSAIRLNGNKAIVCVNVTTIPIENYETWKINPKYLRVQKWRLLDKRRKGNCFWRKKRCYSGLLTPNFHSWNIPKRSHIPNIHEYPKWCCFGNLVRAMPDMHCLVANGDLASLHVLISKLFSS